VRGSVEEDVTNLLKKSLRRSGSIEEELDVFLVVNVALLINFHALRVLLVSLSNF